MYVILFIKVKFLKVNSLYFMFNIVFIWILEVGIRVFGIDVVFFVLGFQFVVGENYSY